jgi:hypothetical protein
MATVDSDKVVCGGIHAMIVAVLVDSEKMIVQLQLERQESIISSCKSLLKSKQQLLEKW